VAYYSSGDKASALPYFLAAVESSVAPPDERNGLLHDVIQLENNAQNYAKVIELGQMAAKAGPLDAAVAGSIAVAYYQTGDYVNAKDFAQKSIDGYTAAGKLPDRGAYQVLLMVQNRQKDIPGETRTLETMSTNYGDAEDWGHLIDISLGMLPKSGTREIAALYLYRLRLTAGAESTADDYMLMADLSLGLHYPGEAQRALQQGISTGVLSQASAAATLNKANAAARSDESTLAAADAIAAKSPSSVQDVSVAEDYYGYGKFADAARVAQRAIPKNGPKALQAQLLLGVAQARLGDNTAAAQSLARVKGDAGLERIAQLWMLYANRKYGQPAAAAPAGK